jgi:hypothetical protein
MMLSAREGGLPAMSGSAAGGVFISYRRQESSGMAGRLHDRLATRFGRAQVFMDVDTIRLGVDFAAEITQAVSTCQVLLAVIGPQWLTATDQDGRRRLEDAEDIVRLEIAAALERDIRVIPILVEGAVMPRRQELPDSLATLARRSALILRHESFPADADRLLAEIEPILRPPAPLPETRNVIKRAQPGSGKLTSAGAPVLPAPQLTGQHGNPLQVQLTWSEVSGAHEYVLERAREAHRGDPELFQEVYRGPDRSYNDVPGESTSLGVWRYRVRASASGQVSGWSDTLSLHTGF